jgi:hypothetical protein
MKDAVGFYWTLPVNWADFRDAGEDVEVASQLSKTIRYQMELVRRWAAKKKYRMAYEIAYTDTRTDRATDGCKASLDKARRNCTDQKAVLVYVDFQAEYFWRENPFIKKHAKALGFETIPLYPDVINVGGKPFDPVKHFREWRRRDKAGKADLREMADQGLLEAYRRFQGGAGRYQLMAGWLNANGVKTPTGKNVWSADNVRKAIKNKIEAAEADESEQEMPALLPGIFE